MSYFKDDTCLSSHSGEIQSCNDSDNAREVLLRILVAGVPPSSTNLTVFQTLKCHFFHPFSVLASKIHTRFQTWRWSQNAALHVYIKQKICHHC